MSIKKEDDVMRDFKKLEKRFHEFLKSGPMGEYYDWTEIRIGEDLLKQEGAVYIPFGWISYFLVIEDERPVIYAHALSRMDLDSICFIDEDGWECHDVFLGGNEQISKKYQSRSGGIRPYDELKRLPRTDKWFEFVVEENI